MSLTLKAASNPQLIAFRESKSITAITQELRNLNLKQDEYWYLLGNRLQKILDERLYRNGYKTFSYYCKRVVGYSRQHIYKLMKCARFIDGLWAQSETKEARLKVQRLYCLGFSKLYLLHSLLPDRLDQLLDEGVPIGVNNFYLKQSIALEEVSITQLKRALKHEPVELPERKLARGRSKAFFPLTSILQVQAQILLQVIEQCQNQLDNRDELADRLKIAEDCATNILEGIKALSRQEPGALPTQNRSHRRK